MRELLAIALDGVAAAWESEAEDSFQRSRRLRSGEDEDSSDQYELGYSEGRSSALKESATQLRKTIAALREAA